MPGNWSDLGGLMKVAFLIRLQNVVWTPWTFKELVPCTSENSSFTAYFSWYVKRFRLNTDWKY